MTASRRVRSAANKASCDDDASEASSLSEPAVSEAAADDVGGSVLATDETDETDDGVPLLLPALVPDALVIVSPPSSESHSMVSAEVAIWAVWARGTPESARPEASDGRWVSQEWTCSGRRAGRVAESWRQASTTKARDGTRTMPLIAA